MCENFLGTNKLMAVLLSEPCSYKGLKQGWQFLPARKFPPGRNTFLPLFLEEIETEHFKSKLRFF